MKNLLLFFLIAMVSLGCSMSSLKLNQNEELIFNHDSNEFLLSSKILERKSLNYKDLYVEQYKLKNRDGKVLFYEEARTELNFEFNYSALYTVMYIFDDAQEYEEVYRNNNLRLIQLKLRDSKSVNILIQGSSTQIISYVYGFSNEEFMKLANSMSDDVKPLKYNSIFSGKPSTNWNDRLVYFTPLITPLRVMGGR